jgi:hypothetical protein
VIREISGTRAATRKDNDNFIFLKMLLWLILEDNDEDLLRLTEGRDQLKGKSSSAPGTLFKYLRGHSGNYQASIFVVLQHWIGVYEQILIDI